MTPGYGYLHIVLHFACQVKMPLTSCPQQIVSPGTPWRDDEDHSELRGKSYQMCWLCLPMDRGRHTARHKVEKKPLTLDFMRYHKWSRLDRRASFFPPARHVR